MFETLTGGENEPKLQASSGELLLVSILAVARAKGGLGYRRQILEMTEFGKASPFDFPSPAAIDQLEADYPGAKLELFEYWYDMLEEIAPGALMKVQSDETISQLYSLRADG